MSAEGRWCEMQARRAFWPSYLVKYTSKCVQDHETTSKTSRNGPRGVKIALARKIDPGIPMDSSIWARRSQTSGQPEVVNPHLFMDETIGRRLKNISSLIARGPPPIYDALARHKLCHAIAIAVPLPIPTHTRACTCRKRLQFAKAFKKISDLLCQP